MIKKFGLFKVILFGIGAFLVLDITARLGIRIAVASLAVYVFLCFIKTIYHSLLPKKKKENSTTIKAVQNKSEKDNITREELSNDIKVLHQVAEKEKVHQ